MRKKISIKVTKFRPRHNSLFISFSLDKSRRHHPIGIVFFSSFWHFIKTCIIINQLHYPPLSSPSPSALHLLSYLKNPNTKRTNRKMRICLITLREKGRRGGGGERSEGVRGREADKDIAITLDYAYSSP